VFCCKLRGGIRMGVFERGNHPAMLSNKDELRKLILKFLD